MDRKRPASSLPLYVGIACLVLAGVGLGYSLLWPKVVEHRRTAAQQAGHEVPATPALPQPSVVAEPPPRAPDSLPSEAALAAAAGPGATVSPAPAASAATSAVPAAAASDSSAPAPRVLERPKRDSRAQAEHRRQMKEAVQARVAQITDTLDLAWFAAHFEHVADTTGLRAYMDEVVALGQQVEPPRADTSVTHAVRRPHTDEPRRRIREAKEVIYAARPSVRALSGRARQSRARAHNLAKDESQGLDRIDAALAASFFKEQAALFGQLAETGAQKADTTAWATQRLRALEAGTLDGYIRLLRLEDRMRRLPGGLPALLGPRAVRPEVLHKALDENLVELGRARLEEAHAETRDLQRVQQEAQAAFEILAMAYRRSSSSKALQAMIRVTELQANTLLEMARASWQLAQQAATSGDTLAAAEYFYRATQRLNECLAAATGDARDALLDEFMRLKRDVAAWYGRDRTTVTARREGL